MSTYKVTLYDTTNPHRKYTKTYTTHLNNKKIVKALVELDFNFLKDIRIIQICQLYDASSQNNQTKNKPI